MEINWTNCRIFLRVRMFEAYSEHMTLDYEIWNMLFSWEIFWNKRRNLHMFYCRTELAKLVFNPWAGRENYMVRLVIHTLDLSALKWPSKENFVPASVMFYVQPLQYLSCHLLLYKHKSISTLTKSEMSFECKHFRVKSLRQRVVEASHGNNKRQK